MLTSFTLARVRKGNSKAFRKLFDAYHAKVFHYLLRFTRDEYDAEDLAQKVFIQLWETRKKIDLKQSFDAYIFTIAHHLACTHLKHKSRRYFTDLEKVKHSLLSSDTEDLIYLNELSELAHGYIEQLPEKRQIIFKMYYEEQHSVEEIAELLQLSVHTVRSQLGKASNTLRQMILKLGQIQAGLMLFFLQ